MRHTGHLRIIDEYLFRGIFLLEPRLSQDMHYFFLTTCYQETASGQLSFLLSRLLGGLLGGFLRRFLLGGHLRPPWFEGCLVKHSSLLNHLHRHLLEK